MAKIATLHDNISYITPPPGPPIGGQYPKGKEFWVQGVIPSQLPPGLRGRVQNFVWDFWSRIVSDPLRGHWAHRNSAQKIFTDTKICFVLCAMRIYLVTGFPRPSTTVLETSVPSFSWCPTKGFGPLLPLELDLSIVRQFLLLVLRLLSHFIDGFKNTQSVKSHTPQG